MFGGLTSKFVSLQTLWENSHIFICPMLKKNFAFSTKSVQLNKYLRLNGSGNTISQKECVAQGQTLLNSQLWESTVNYVLLAWEYVEGMPDWDNPVHNKSKEQCYKALAVQCKKAIMKLKSSLSEDKCKDLHER